MPHLGEPMPTTLLDLLSNSLVLHQTAPYLPVAAIFSLAATSKAFHNLVHWSPECFRYLDLSTVKSAVVPYVPLDSGGINWRAERMDEALTEDEFYSGPLRGIFSKLSRRHVLYNVHTLVLDGLSVPADLVREIIAEDRFNVRILSIRESKHLNERKLQQVLRYACRPTRAAGTPRLKGLYVFGARDNPEEPPKPRRSPPRSPSGVLSSKGAVIGAQWNERSSQVLTAALSRTDDKWYQSSGRLFKKRPSAEWAETLRACEGIIFFDAVLCRGPRHDFSYGYHGIEHDYAVQHPFSFLQPAVASVALGPSGCASCSSCPEGKARFGVSDPSQLPLLAPPPLHSSRIRACQMPQTTDGSPPPPLIARCEDCVRGRWCERCNKWWDEPCYAGSAISQRTHLQNLEFMENIRAYLGEKHEKELKMIGVRRECFGCGHTCSDCKDLYIRACRLCRNEYCIIDNDASSYDKCDWCNYSGRRTRELY